MEEGGSLILFQGRLYGGIFDCPRAIPIKLENFLRYYHAVFTNVIQEATLAIEPII